MQEEGHVNVTPISRENAASARIKNQIYLYGGRSKQILKDFYSYDIKYKSWSKCEQRGDIPTVGRFGHSMTSVYDELFVFGGKKVHKIRLLEDQDEYFMDKECTNDMFVYNTWTS